SVEEQPSAQSAADAPAEGLHTSEPPTPRAGAASAGAAASGRWAVPPAGASPVAAAASPLEAVSPVAGVAFPPAAGFRAPAAASQSAAAFRALVAAFRRAVGFRGLAAVRPVALRRSSAVRSWTDRSAAPGHRPGRAAASRLAAAGPGLCALAALEPARVG